MSTRYIKDHEQGSARCIRTAERTAGASIGAGIYLTRGRVKSHLPGGHEEPGAGVSHTGAAV